MADVQEATRSVYQRVRNLDAANASKLVGWLLMQDHADQEMHRLAMASDTVISSILSKARKELGLSPPISQHQLQSGLEAFFSQGLSGLSLDPYPNNNLRSPADSPKPFHNHYLHGQNSLPPERNYFPHEDLNHRLAARLGSGSFPKMGGSGYDGLGLSRSLDTGSLNLPNLDVGYPNGHGWKPCMYYARGFCKHGASCKFLHSPGSSPRMGGPDQYDHDGFSLEDGTPLEHLELELRSLLAGRPPVNLALLPQLYAERFGKVLRAKGYSAANGKAGLTLTLLLEKINGIYFLERPDGFKAVCLAEDAGRFSYKNGVDPEAERSSRQIYLTFPATSVFGEQDVRDYFSRFGKVEDVRIPYQQQRMFGFVTFSGPDAARAALAAENPHQILEAFVLVKPYKFKGKAAEHHRKLLSPKENYHVPPRIQRQRFPNGPQENLISPGSGSGSDSPSSLNYHSYESDEALNRRLQEEEAERENERRRAAALAIGDAQRRRLEAEASMHRAESMQNRRLECNDYSLDLNNFQSDNPFGYLLNDNETESEDSDKRSHGENHQSHSLWPELEEGLGGSPSHKWDIPRKNGLNGSLNGINGTRAGSPLQNGTPLSNMTDHDLTCCICLEYYEEPIGLECSHTFCVKCISQVIKATRDECPMCRQKLSPAILRFLETRDPHWTAPQGHLKNVFRHQTQVVQAPGLPVW